MADCKLVYDIKEELYNGNTVYYRTVNGCSYESGILLKNEDILEVYSNISGSDDLINVLEGCIARRNRVRIWYGSEDGRSWLEEYDVVGYIGRTSGNIKAPILLANKNSRYGAFISVGRIIRIDDIANHTTLFKQSNFYVPLMEIRKSEYADYLEGVYVKEKDGSWNNYANFKKEGAALHWAQFMAGIRYTKGGR